MPTLRRCGNSPGQSPWKGAGQTRGVSRRTSIIRWPKFCRAGFLALLFFSSARTVATTAMANKITLTWQPISPEDLSLKDNPADPGKDAMILYHEVFIDNRNFSILEYERIKIFTEAGRKWADISLRYVPGEWEIKDIQARTIQPDGKIIDFDGKVSDQLVVKARGIKVLDKKFSLPSVQPGCIIEYIYRRAEEPRFTSEYEWPVQGDLYTRLGVYSIRPILDAGLSWRKHKLPAGLKPEKQPDGSYRLEIKDLPGLRSEEYTPPDKVARARVSFFFRFGPVTAPEEYWKNQGALWDKGLESFLNKKKFLESKMEETVRPEDPPEAKLRKLYERAQQIRNLDYEKESKSKGEKKEKMKPDDTIEDVIKRGYGTSREINDALTGLARAAGFDATQVLVTSRDEDFFAPGLQDWSQLNTDVVYIRSGSQDLYLDPGDPFCPYGVLPWYVAGVKGLRIRLGGGELVTTTEPRSSDYLMVRDAKLHLDEDGSLSGKFQVEFREQRACILREVEREEDDSGRNKDLTDIIKSWLPENAIFDIGTVTGWDSNSAPIHAEGTLRLSSYATVSGKRTLLPITFLVAHETKAFQSTVRANDIYFDYPFEEHDDFEIELPPSLNLEALPSAQKAEQPSMALEVTTAANGAVIQVHRRLEVKQYLFAAQAYASVRDFFNAVSVADEQQIVLSPH